MPVVFPQSPSTNDEFATAGKVWTWTGSFWRRIKYAIIDGGFSITEISEETSIADGGNA